VSRVSFFSFLTLLATFVACAPTPFRPAQTVSTEQEASPLGPSYVLIPLPSEEETLLGRILPELPRAGRSLEEISRPNPCAEALTEPKVTPLASTFVDAQEVSGNAQAKAMLGVFGFEGDASKASHFAYHLETSRRAALTDTNEYVKCCDEHEGECGVGFVSALVYGEGEYSTGEETSARGAVTVPMAGAGGGVRLRVLHRRKVKGYLAALVTLTNKKSAALGPLGIAAFEPTIPQRVQEAYEKEKVSIVELQGDDWILRTGREFLTENEFARRYEKETGSDELRPVEQRRNTTAVVVTGVLTAGALYGTYWGFTNLKRECKPDDVECWESTTGSQAPPGTQCVSRSSVTGDCNTYIDPNDKVTNPWGIIAATSFSIVSLTVGTAFIALLVNGDGTPMEHVMTQDDTRLRITRYNRSVLRRAKEKIRRQIRIEQQAGLRLVPVAGPQGFGLAGTF
jgi:hypothetical protein